MHTHKQHTKSHVHHVGNATSITSPSSSPSSSSSSSAIFTTRATSPLPTLNRTELSVDEPITPICTPPQRLHEELERHKQHGNQCTSLTFVYNDADLSEAYITRKAIFCRINVPAETSVLHGVLTLDAADLLWLYELTLSRQGNNTQNDKEYVIKGMVEEEEEDDNCCTSPLPLHQRDKSAMSSTSTSPSSSSTFRISTPMQVETEKKITVINALASQGYENEFNGAAIPRSVRMYTISAQCDSKDIIRNTNLYSADSNVEAAKECELTNITTTTTTTAYTTKDLLEDIIENDTSQYQANEKLKPNIKDNTKKKNHNLLSRIFDLSTRWVSQYNDNVNDITNTINTNSGIIDDKTKNCKTTHDFTYNTIVLCRKDGLPNVQTVALVMEMLFDEHIQRAAVEFTEMTERLTTHHEYTVNLHTQIRNEVNTLICNHNAIYAAELSRNAVERLQVLESALRNSLVSSCMTTYLHLHQLKAEEGRDVLLMSRAHEYADKLEEARFQIRVKHSRHLRAVDELQQAQIKCLALMPSLAIMLEEENNKNTNYENNEMLKVDRCEQHYCLEKKSREHEYKGLEYLEKPKDNVAMCALKELFYSIDNAIDLLTDDGCQTNEPTVTPLPPSLKQALHERFATV